MANQITQQGEQVLTQGSLLDPTNPYFVHSSENPRSKIVTTILNGDNYHAWAREMEMALETKNKAEFVNGVLPRPANSDPIYPYWKRCNNLVVSWLNHSVDTSILQSILWMETGQEIWEDLRERYYQGNVFRISELMREMHNIKQGSLSIGAYFSQIKGLWQQLNTFNPIPSCLCEVKCRCTLVPIIKKYRENEYVICFLMGLNEQFSVVKTQIMLMDPLPSVNKALSLLAQHERQNNLVPDDGKFLANLSRDNSGNNPKDSKGRSFSAQGIARQHNQFKPRGSIRGGRCVKICTYCHKQGHTIDVCYKKHGYPPNYFSNSSNINSYMAQQPAEDEQFANNPNSSDSSSKEPNEGALLGLTEEQHRGLVSLLENSNNSQHHHVNHIVSAATQHETRKSGPPILEDDWCS